MAKPVLSNTTYDALKYLTQIVLPAFGTLYFALAQLWNLPAPEQVVGTIAAVTTFLGVSLRIASSNYEAGTMQIGIKDDGTKVYSLVLASDPEDLATLDRVVFRVVTK